MGVVFISYRREDAAGFAGRIYDRLAQTLGRENVFIDVDNIPAGLDFVDVLSDRVGRCDALIAIVGKHWLTSANEDNSRRLDDANDFVRVEIEAALNRNVPVIPVLVDGAVMPRADELPDGLKKLVRRQGIDVSHNRFDSDAERLTDALARIEGRQPERPSASAASRASEPASPYKSAAGVRRLAAAAAAIVLLGGGAAGVLYVQRQAQPQVAAPAEPSHASIPSPRDGAPNPTQPNPAPDKTPTGKVGESAPNPTANAGAQDTPAASPQWMNVQDFQREFNRRLSTYQMYPEKVEARCQDNVPQRRVTRWLPRASGQYFTLSLDLEADFKSAAAGKIADGYTKTFETVFQGCRGSVVHITGWMKGG